MNTKHFMLLAMLFASIIGKAQEISENKETLTLGINAGYGINSNAYQTMSTNNKFSYYGIDSQFSFGADLGLYVTPRLRPRVELRYSEYDYGMNWLSSTSYSKTECTIFNLDLNVHLDYKFVEYKKLKIFISPGIVNEFALGEQYKTYKINNDDPTYKEYADFNEEYPDAISGANLEMPIKYNLNRWLGVTVTPSYTCFFKKFRPENSNPYQRFSINAGVEIKLY